MNMTPPEVRILPMDSRKEFEGKDAEEVQKEFFLKKLPLERNGCYWYCKKGLRAKPGAVVLFQYGGSLIASAVFIRSIEFPRRRYGRYKGVFHFEANSIRVFNPVHADEVRRIWPDFKGFGRNKSFLKPQHYPKFIRSLKGIEKPRQNLQPSFSHVHVRNQKGLGCLRPVLQRWIELNNDLAERWYMQGDAPWWYNERAVLGLFSSAIWLEKGVSLEEYSDSKRAVSPRGHFSGESFTGRADLYFETSSDSCYRAEAKHCWIRATTMKDQKPKLREHLDRVTKDIRQAQREDNTRRIVIVFVTPSVSFKRTAHLKRHVKWIIAQVKSLNPDAIAWTFPKIGKYGNWTEYTYPGIVILIKEVR